MARKRKSPNEGLSSSNASSGKTQSTPNRARAAKGVESGVEPQPVYLKKRAASRQKTTAQTTAEGDDAPPSASGLVKQRRLYQRAALRIVRDNRTSGLLWARQKGKSTTLSEIAIYAMMKRVRETVTYASASLLLGREIILKESAVMQRALEWMADEAKRAQMELQTADRENHKILTGLTADDFADLFEAQRLEFRLYHDRTTYSRTQVIAPNAATARGWTGWVLMDEIAFIRDLKDLWDGVLYIINANPDFRLVMATTIPVDDRHFSYNLLAEPVGMEFTPNPEGNVYQSQGGIPVLRVDIDDAHAAGVKVYDLKSGAPITPQEAFALAIDKDSFKRNEKLVWMVGGSAAVDLLALDTAQRRGIGQCACIVIDSDLDFERAIQFLSAHLGSGHVGLGFDVATTTKQTSNPSSVTVIERNGVELAHRAVVLWKTKNPKIARERLRRIVQCIAARPAGGSARRLCIDASNERYFAEETRDEFSGLVPVELVINGTAVHPPGYEESSNMKTWLGDKYTAAIHDNRCLLPPEAYLKDDYRLVIKDRGSYVCEPQSDGKHGDTFDSGKLALHALTSNAGGAFTAETVNQVAMQQNPWRLQGRLTI